MTLPFEKVNVIGLGYVGLPTAAILATGGVDVVGVEVNQSIVASINRGQPHFVEAALDTLLHAVVASGKLRATDQPEPADCFVIAVPTPFCDGSHDPDLSHIDAAAQATAPLLRAGNLIILESTSPVGTTHRLCESLASARPDLSFPHDTRTDPQIHVAHCPERILPGRVLRELVENDRIIGGVTPACAERARQFYRIFVQGQCVLTDARTAELAKLAENAYRDVNIGFANELSMICDQHHIDVWELIRLANHHPRVNILQPGPGVGGHCIAVDPWFIVSGAPEQSRLIRAAREVNDAKPAHVVEQIARAIADLDKPTVACLGLTFKPDVDDLRQSPALEVVSQLASRSPATLLVVDPHVSELPAQLAGFKNVKLTDLDAALNTADAVVLLVHHRQFIELDPANLQDKTIIDTRGIWNDLTRK